MDQGEHEAAIEDDLFGDPADGVGLADDVVEIARGLAAAAIDDAQGGDRSRLKEANRSLDRGDRKRAKGKYKEAAAAYKEAVAAAEGA